MTTQTSQSVLINGFGVLFVIVNSFGLGLRLEVGKLLAEAFAHWKIAVWALVIDFVIIPLLFIGYLLTIAESIPGEIKVGFCVAALAAGMPFAPLLARLAKADVSIATTLLVVLTVGTIIALPIGLPLAIDAVDAQLKTSVSDVLAAAALLAPAVDTRVRLQGLVARPDAAVRTVGCPSRNSVSALQSQLHAGGVLGSVRGYLGHQELHSGPCRPIHRARVWLPSRFQSSSQRRGNQACDRSDHGGTNIAPMLLMMIFPFAADPLVTVSITILNTIGIVTVVLFVLMWRWAVSPSDSDGTANQPASEGLLPPAST